MNKLLKQTLVCAGTLLLSMQVAAKPSSEAKEVRGIIDKVNTYWQTHNKPEVRFGTMPLTTPETWRHTF